MQRKTEGAGRETSSILKLEPKDEVSKREAGPLVGRDLYRKRLRQRFGTCA
jgi:hypothetical protein